MKPTVHYDLDYPAIIEVGKPAFIKPIDHPSDMPGQLVSNTKMILTSNVQWVDEYGMFETLNTRYVPRRTFQ